MTDDPRAAPRDIMTYDVLIVGGGPAGLACAIALRQKAVEQGRELSVCVIEKGSEIGAHQLSGAVLDPIALNELIPDWAARGAPLTLPAGEDRFLFLTRKRAFRLPTPPTMNNHGAFILRLGNFAQWLAQQAEALGVEIYPGFAGAEILYKENGAVAGVATGDPGLNRAGEPGPRFARGVELRAHQTVFAEGCRGSLTKQLFERFALRQDCSPQTYGLGVKEVWEIDPAKHRPGFVQHTIGWPLDARTYGGSFLYHLEPGQVAVGFVVGLDYENPWLSPFEEFQRFKDHPGIRPLFEGGKRLAYGARALSEGGIQSLPKLTFPGGLLVGDAAGFLNVPRIKGIHTAMKSGMVAAEALLAHLGARDPLPEVTGYEPRLRRSWLWQELWSVRNVRPSFHAGLWAGMAWSGLDTLILKGRVPWTFPNHADHLRLLPASAAKPIAYPPPDNVVRFDRLSSLYLSGTRHEEDQPCHLQLLNPELALEVNLGMYDSPETRYCPAGVYEIVRDAGGANPRLVINASNCLHCKTCDIKDPSQNINWTTPEGGGGPNYRGL